MKNIYLVGFMGTGKSTVGKILARELHKEFIEMDEAIEKRCGQKIAQVFAQNGERHFRFLEKALLKDLAQNHDLVVSCGGGLICDEDNLLLLKDSGTVFALWAQPETIYQRTQGSSHRPLLNTDDPLARIRELLEKRAPYYCRAHYRIITDSLTPQGVVEKINAIVRHG